MQDATGRGSTGRRGRTGRLLALGCALVTIGAGCAWIREVSVSPLGVSGDGASGGSAPAVSADGRFVAFESLAANLVAGADGGLFVRDTAAGTTTVASVRADGSFTDGTDPAISSTGRYVAFVSSDLAMVPGLTGGHDQVFLRDRFTRTTKLVSVKSGATNPGNDDSEAPSISADGRYVAFESDAANLVPFDTNASTDVFVRDLVGGTTTRVNVNLTAEEPFFGADSASISADGRFVAFATFDSPTGEDTPSQDIYLRDRLTSTTQMVSRKGATGISNGFSADPRVSANGRFVAFLSNATNLDAAPDGNGALDVFVRDTVAKATTRVSLTPANGVLQSGSRTPSISGDGRFVSYVSASPDVVPSDTNLAADVFVRDRPLARTTRVDTAEKGAQAPTGGMDGSLSADGRYVAFLTDSPLTASHTGSLAQLLIRHVVTPTVTAVTPSTVAPGTTTNVVITGSGFLAGAAVTITGDGLTVGPALAYGEGALLVPVSATPTAPHAPRDVYVTVRGTGPGPAAGAVASCTGCLRVA
jgi:Tol biopolymer transport system component